MSIKVSYFASLKDLVGRACDEIPAQEGLTARDIWQQLHPKLAMPAAVLVAINLEYVTLDTPVKAGDQLAFFPPVTGG